MEGKKSFFERKSVVAAFGVIALFAGFFFLNVGFLNLGLTGNVINSEYVSVNFLSVIGLLLIVCAAVLIIYSIVKEE